MSINPIARYAASYGVGAFAGILNELLVNPNNHWAIVNPSWKVSLVATVGNIYGYATMAATGLFDLTSKKGPVVQIVIATVAAVAIEGVAGLISKKFHKGEHKWKYPKSWIPFFDGYVSVVSTLYFGIGIAAFYFLFYKPFLL
jgi:hypothetical protein